MIATKQNILTAAAEVAEIRKRADDAVAEIRKRADDATPGPWEAVKSLPVWAVAGPTYDVVPATGREYRQPYKSSEMYGVDAFDAAFIAHARTDVPALCDDYAKVMDQRDAALARVKALETDAADRAEKLASARETAERHIAESHALRERVKVLEAER